MFFEQTIYVIASGSYGQNLFAEYICGFGSLHPPFQRTSLKPIAAATGIAVLKLPDYSVVVAVFAGDEEGPGSDEIS